MKKEQLIEKIFSRSENPAQSVEDLGNLCPFLFATPQSREVFNKALRKHGYEINESYFQETDQIVMGFHSSCGSSDSFLHPSCDTSDSFFRHPSCGSSSSYGGHQSCCSSTKKPYAKIILPIKNEIGNQNGITN